VREHPEELVLAAIGVAKGRLRLLQVGDLDTHDAEPAFAFGERDGEVRGAPVGGLAGSAGDGALHLDVQLRLARLDDAPHHRSELADEVRRHILHGLSDDRLSRQPEVRRRDRVGLEVPELFVVEVEDPGRAREEGVERRLGRAPRVVGAPSLGDVAEEDRDPVRAGLAQAEGVDVVPSPERLGGPLEADRLAGPGHAAVDDEPVLLVSGRQLPHPSPSRIDEAGALLERAVHVLEHVVDRVAGRVEQDLDHAEAHVDGVEDLAVPRLAHAQLRLPGPRSALGTIELVALRRDEVLDGVADHVIEPRVEPCQLRDAALLSGRAGARLLLRLRPEEQAQDGRAQQPELADELGELVRVADAARGVLRRRRARPGRPRLIAALEPQGELVEERREVVAQRRPGEVHVAAVGGHRGFPAREDPLAVLAKERVS
jgi:hypothetical protein